MYVVVLANGNLLTVDFATRWFKAKADALAAKNNGTVRPVQKSDPRS